MSSRARKNDAEPPLPHNSDAERAALGAVLLDNAVLNTAMENLKAEDFFHDAHRRIFNHMIQLGSAQEPIDLVTLTDHLNLTGELEACGGAAYISQLVDGVPRVSNLEHYARIIKDKAVLRRLIHASSRIQETAMQGGEDALTILDRARLELAQLDAQQDATDIFDTWEEFQNAKPLRAIIDNFLYADVANVVGGLSGEGKTLILLACAKAELTHKPLFGYFPVLEPPDRCIYLIPECARSPFFHRIRLFRLEEFLQNGRLLVRTLTKGRPIPLDDSRLLRVVKDASVKIDTAIRYAEGDESSATDTSRGLATAIFGLLTAGALCVQVAQHSPKDFTKANYISLENCLRGSGDFGAFVGAGFGIRQIDKAQNVIFLSDIKPRDSEPAPPFQIIGRPYIDQEGDFRIHRPPGMAGKLSDFLEQGNRGGAGFEARETRAAKLELLREWIASDPNQTSDQLSARFKAAGFDVSAVTVRKYRQELTEREKESGG